MATNSDVEAMDTDHVGDLAKGPGSEEGPMEVEGADSNPGSHSDIRDEPRKSRGEEAVPNGHGCLTRCCKWCNRLFDCFKYMFPIVPCDSAVDVDPGDIEKRGGEDNEPMKERQEREPSPIRSRVSLISQILN